MRFLWTPFAVILASLGLLSFFQNCTPAVPYGNTDYYQSLVNSPVFPYEVGVDQVAYMSCSEQAEVFGDSETFFTFRVGAFNSHGIRITEEYKNHIEKVDDEDVPFALSQAQASSNARVQIAVRPSDNLQALFRDEENGDTGLNGSDHSMFFPPLGDEYLNEVLYNLDHPFYLRTYAPAQNINQYRFEGELNFMKSIRMEEDLRSFFNSRGLISITFAEVGDVYPIGPGSLAELQDLYDNGQSGNVNLPIPGTDDSGGVGTAALDSGKNKSQKSASFTAASNDLLTNVFGAAIKPRFKQPLFQGGSPGPDMPPRVLSAVEDVVIDDRKNGTLESPWACPNSMQFMIVLPEHAIYQDENSNTITRCSMNPDPINQTEELKIIRQSLLAEDYYVDLVKKCVVPKPDHTVAGSCYGKNDSEQTHLINYDSFDTNGCGFGNANGLCPHYVSICFRQ